MALIDDFKAKFGTDFTTEEIGENWANLDPEYRCIYPADLDDDCDKIAALYVIAHLLYIRMQDSQASFRLTQSKTVRDISVSYAQVVSSSSFDSFFNTCNIFCKNILN